MRPADQTEYIVQCIREGGSMYEDDARTFLTEHDAHVRADALAEADLLPKAHVVAWLTKKAREFRSAGGRERAAQADALAAMASKVERGAIRPNNLRTLPPDFFEPGRTYEYAALHILFRCDAVSTHPTTGERSAVGWTRYHGRGWSSADYSPAEYADGWTDITDTTTRKDVRP